MRDEEDKKIQKKLEEKVRPVEEEKEGIECPHCHSVNELEAEFCAECGYDFTGRKVCPKCGARAVSPTADICEVCGEWLLEGKCKFCYADLEEGATYCPECGNPVVGIVCPKCGKLSYFDFCKYCNIPLTAMAQEMIEKMKKSDSKPQEVFSSNQEARRYYMAERYLVLIQQPEVVQKDEKDELLKMKEYLEKVEKKKKHTFTPLFTEAQKQSIKGMGAVAEEEIKRQEEERRRKEEEERRRQEEEKKRQEEERRRKEEEERRKSPRGWLCNAYGCLHPGGPPECADPSQGGHWVY